MKTAKEAGRHVQAIQSIDISTQRVIKMCHLIFFLLLTLLFVIDFHYSCSVYLTTVKCLIFILNAC